MKGGVNMQKLNRKGLSEVVTAIIVILLVLVAVGIIWAVVQNLLNQGSEEAKGGVDCITTQINVESATKVAVNSYTVSVVRQTGGPKTIDNLKLVFSDGTQTEAITPTGTPISIDELGRQTFTAVATTKFGTSDAKTVSVAPVINQKVCNPIGEHAISITGS